MSKIPENLVIFEMANNHMGSLTHGIKIIEEYAKFIVEFPVFNFAFKLQYRDLDTFIRPDYVGRTDVKHIKRFEETRLSDRDCKKLVSAMQQMNFLKICTPFDEISVDRVLSDNFDILKIASCSFGDWPLLEKAVEAKLPIIASTAGATIEQLDNVISFFENRNVDFIMQHCVGEYPTLPQNMNLNQLDYLRNRHPNVRFGFSTHEDPDDTNLVQIAIAKGAASFEKHVGLPTPDWPLNAYSSNLAQTRKWLNAAERAFIACGPVGQRYSPSKEEVESLSSLQRGVFARSRIKKGTMLTQKNTFFAFPPSKAQITASDFSKYNKIYANVDIEVNAAIQHKMTRVSNHRNTLLTYAKRAIELVKSANVIVPKKFDLEISHHYGLENFEKVGIAMITTVNREYCKKILICLPGQSHPEQYHRIKEETFNVLHGDLTLTLDAKQILLGIGEVITIRPGQKHHFFSKEGAVLEEISTTHLSDDSYYTDKNIMANRGRKSVVKWVM